MSKIPHCILLAKSIVTHSNEEMVIRDGTDPQHILRLKIE